MCCGLLDEGVSYAFERLEDRGKGIALVRMAFDGDQNVKRAVVVDDAQVSASKV